MARRRTTFPWLTAAEVAKRYHVPPNIAAIFLSSASTAFIGGVLHYHRDDRRTFRRLKRWVRKYGLDDAFREAGGAS